jgi:hypothetical protein
VDVRTRLLIWAEDMPVVDKVADGNLIRLLYEREPGATIAVEKVQWMGSADRGGGQSVARMMLSMGVALGVAQGMGRPTVQMTPQTWKGVLGLNKDKERSRKRAIELWPEHADRFKFKLNVDRAEAALIALVHVDYIRRHGITITADDFPW